MQIKLSHPDKKLSGRVSLEGSKSISNRILVIKHLAKSNARITNVSKSDDTKYLADILENIQEVNDVHHAGTAFRFLTSVLSFTHGTQVLTGSPRMKQRPIGPLVEALRTIGANIEYLGVHGFPPLKIGSPSLCDNNRIRITGNVSSQFISSLALIAPIRPLGLVIEIEGKFVSKPYLDMTLDIMNECGVYHIWDKNTLTIHPGKYEMHNFHVESDWSSASYLFSMASIAEESDIKITGLFRESLQPDSVIQSIASQFAVNSNFQEEELKLNKSNRSILPFLEYNFNACPDVAQTVFVMCAAHGVKGLFGGLNTLKIKETDRIQASSAELAKINVFLHAVPSRFASRSEDSLFMQDGKAQWVSVAFNTYDDHRMAMSFAPLALIRPFEIRDAEVVSKSYPRFWDDLSDLGFSLEIQ